MYYHRLKFSTIVIIVIYICQAVSGNTQLWKSREWRLSVNCEIDYDKSDMSNIEKQLKQPTWEAQSLINKAIGDLNELETPTMTSENIKNLIQKKMESLQTFTRIKNTLNIIVYSDPATLQSRLNWTVSRNREMGSWSTKVTLELVYNPGNDPNAIISFDKSFLFKVKPFRVDMVCTSVEYYFNVASLTVRKKTLASVSYYKFKAKAAINLIFSTSVEVKAKFSHKETDTEEIKDIPYTSINPFISMFFCIATDIKAFIVFLISATLYDIVFVSLKCVIYFVINGFLFVQIIFFFISRRINDMDSWFYKKEIIRFVFDRIQEIIKTVIVPICVKIILSFIFIGNFMYYFWQYAPYLFYILLSFIFLILIIPTSREKRKV
ncbi:unnamed protein product [Owenia fusiformis]|uniref:Uncharacterized protein n=1 Tax=Owenia fusiformis TaxID=6347 RepID=A0A8J1Y453_OWEFU|nr:unnamed protein product [Owenia fusiformis]